jgi:hypothetical protein
MMRATAVATREGFRMTISLDYNQLRVFAQLLRERTGRDVKHSHILKQIAAAKAAPYDALMHRLKNSVSDRIQLEDAELEAIAAGLSLLASETISGSSLYHDATAAVSADTPAGGDRVCVSFWSKDNGVRYWVYDENEFDDFGFDVANLDDAEKLADYLEQSNVRRRMRSGDTPAVDPLLKSQFSLRLLNLPISENQFKRSGLDAIDRVLNALTEAFAPRGTRYIVDGCVFHGPNRAHRQPAIESATEVAPSPQAMASTVRKLEAMALSLQSLPPVEWPGEMDVDGFVDELRRIPHEGPTWQYGCHLSEIYRALGVLVDFYQVAQVPLVLNTVDGVAALSEIIEVMVRKDLQNNRRGNEAERRRLAEALSGTVATAKKLEKLFTLRSTARNWEDAIYTLMKSSRWNVCDDVAAYVPRNPMTAHNGYRPTEWKPE